MHTDDEFKDPYSTYQAVTDIFDCKISNLNGKKQSDGKVAEIVSTKNWTKMILLVCPSTPMSNNK